jgi:hypothetical protein
MKIRLVSSDETVVKKDTLPFIKDVHRLIEKHPEYLEGIRAGVVHIGFNPGHREAIKIRHPYSQEQEP